MRGISHTATGALWQGPSVEQRSNLVSDSAKARSVAHSQRRPIRTRGGWPVVGAELALGAVTLSVVYGLTRLFLDTTFARGAIVAAIGSHLVAAISRRLGLGSITALAASAVAMVFTLAATLYNHTTSTLIPTEATWSAVGSDLGDAWDAFGVVKAPTEVLPGFILAIAVAVWLIAAVADLAAFRVRTVVEALVPATTLFVFTAMLGQPSGRVGTTSVFLATVAAFLVFIRIALPLNASVPIESTRSRQPKALLTRGVSVAGAAVVLGLVFGPLLPGVDQGPVLDWKELDGGSGGSRVTLSPLVDARGRLVEQADVELFRVSTTSEVGAYWRTTALDNFDGGIWGSSYSYRDARGTLAIQDTDHGFETIDTTFAVSNLGDIWFPAPFEAITFSGADAKWDSESSTLVTKTGQFTTGVTYTVRSAIPIYDPEQLRLASSFVPPEILERYTALPEDFSTRVQDLAFDLTETDPTQYEKAFALQSFFRAEFEYTTEVQLGHDLNRVEQFLFVERTGYCEQFAGTYAAMARAIGLPARVAIGFTPGDRVGGEFVVRGRNYHAWPEVWIDGSWVPFEPTPGRGSPQAEAWTGVSPQQDVSREILIEDELIDNPTLSNQDNLFLEEQFPDFELGQDPSLGGNQQGGGVPQWIITSIIGLTAITILAGLWWTGMPALEQRLRTKRRAKATSRSAEVVHAWEDLIEALTGLGLPQNETETRREYVRRVSPRSRLDHSAMGTVALLTDQATYSGADVDDEIALQARRLVRGLEVELAARTSQTDRARQRIHPGRLLRELRRRS